MKFLSTLLFSALVVTTIEKSRNRYLLVKIYDAKEKGTFEHIVKQIVAIQNLLANRKKID